MTARIGAEVTGVDLAGPLDDDQVARLRRGLLDHLVLFFRDQHLDDEAHMRFALRFGTLNMPPMRSKDSTSPGITVLDQRAPKGEGADEWHADNTFMARPPMGSVLRCLRLPDVGGDTLWANMYAAYEALSAPVRAMIDGLTAVHDITSGVIKAAAKGHPLDLPALQRFWPPVEHPVVVTHPETGRRALYVNRASTTRIVGLTVRENEALLPFLLDHVRSPEWQVRLRWEPGTVAFWDNRATQHNAVPDYTQPRLMHRVTIDGPSSFD